MTVRKHFLTKKNKAIELAILCTRESHDIFSFQKGFSTF